MTYEEYLEQCAKEMGWDSFEDLRQHHSQLNSLIEIMSTAAEMYKEDDSEYERRAHQAFYGKHL